MRAAMPRKGCLPASPAMARAQWARTPIPAWRDNMCNISSSSCARSRTTCAMSPSCTVSRAACKLPISRPYRPICSPSALEVGLSLWRPAQRHRQIAAELLDEVDRDASMHASLAVEKPRLVIERHERTVPDVRMNVEALVAIAPERHEILRPRIVSRECKRHQKALTVHWIEELAAVGMIVGAADHDAFAHTV